jgi:hypothetical protein
MHIPYVGPLLTGATVEAPASVLHNESIAGGGAAATKGYRELDEYNPNGGEVEDVGLSSADGAGVNSVTRPNPGAVAGALRVTQAYTGDGVPGGSTVNDEDVGGTEVGEIIDVAGRAISTGKDRFGRTKGTPNSGAGIKDFDYTNFDARSALSGDGGYAVGVGRGTSTDGVNVTHTLARAVVDTTPGSAGTVGISDGGAGGLVRVDLHATDVAAPRAGFQVSLFKRDTGDNEEDGACIGVFDVDVGTDITDLLTDATLAGTTIVIYARKRNDLANGGAASFVYGPLSERVTLAVT